jgi:hypothetical protein
MPRSIFGPEIVVISTKVSPLPNLQSAEFSSVQVLNLECALLLEPKWSFPVIPPYTFMAWSFKARPHYSYSCYSLYTLRVNIRILTRRNLASNWSSVDEYLRAQVKARRVSVRAQAWRAPARARVMWTHLNNHEDNFINARYSAYAVVVLTRYVEGAFLRMQLSFVKQIAIFRACNNPRTVITCVFP